MLSRRLGGGESQCVFHDRVDCSYGGTYTNHLRQTVRAMLVRAMLKWPKDFVIHSLRHTLLTRLGDSGADAGPATT